LHGDYGFVPQDFHLVPYRHTRLTEEYLLEKFGVGMNSRYQPSFDDHSSGK
jgi:hypothetical protein